MLIYRGLFPFIRKLRLEGETVGPKPGEDPLSTHESFHGSLQKEECWSKDGLFKGKLTSTKPSHAN